MVMGFGEELLMTCLPVLCFGSLRSVMMHKALTTNLRTPFGSVLAIRCIWWVFSPTFLKMNVLLGDWCKLMVQTDNYD